MSLQQTILISSVAVLVALIITIDRILVRRRAFKRFETRLRRYALWAPTVIGLTTAYGLISAALERGLLVPERAAADTTFGTILIISELIAAGLLTLGLFTRLAALAVLVVCTAAVVHTPWHQALPLVVVFGNALFLLVWGRGRLSLGSFFSRFIAMDPGHIRFASTVVLRATIAAALGSLAFFAAADGQIGLAIIYIGGATFTITASFPRLVAPMLLLVLALQQNSAPYLAGALGALIILGKANDLDEIGGR